MSALVPEPPALVRSPEEQQHGGHEPGHVLAQLSAALDSPNVRALEWSKNGQSVLVHTELYEEEMRKNKELFPELADLGCVAALQAWLLAYGFKLKGAKLNAQVLLLQHPDFQRTHPTAQEPGALGGDVDLSAKQKKTKKKRCVSSLHPRRGAAAQGMLELLQLVSYSKALAGKWFSASGSSCTSPGQRPRLRPLYQYINFDMPELMDPSAEEDEVPGLAEPSQVPADPRRTIGPHLEDTCASDILALGAGDKSMQFDIDRMLRYAAHLVPPLFPQYK
ncbi:hypothetical protein AV530_015029 [Patagioenas fasciata monilis]|uniref:HSF-type DNA-binding domain-containing protein n=1 Tax=Patagioenas fasciata monilis TaxID=372326 RepID=A0A1V4K294_PATFA|nr:hypothetical protein AV530_015029 [Patagioenas fasciata monilis]